MSSLLSAPDQLRNPHSILQHAYERQLPSHRARHLARLGRRPRTDVPAPDPRRARALLASSRHAPSSIRTTPAIIGRRGTISTEGERAPGGERGREIAKRVEETWKWVFHICPFTQSSFFFSCQIKSAYATVMDINKRNPRLLVISPSTWNDMT